MFSKPLFSSCDKNIGLPEVSRVRADPDIDVGVLPCFRIFSFLAPGCALDEVILHP